MDFGRRGERNNGGIEVLSFLLCQVFYSDFLQLSFVISIIHMSTSKATVMGPVSPNDSTTTLLNSPLRMETYEDSMLWN